MLYPGFGDLSELDRRLTRSLFIGARNWDIQPALADKYREYSEYGGQSFDVVTVFKFAQNLLTCVQTLILTLFQQIYFSTIACNFMEGKST